jgi:hypothetical protein
MGETWRVGTRSGGRSLLFVALLASTLTAGYVLADPLRRRLASLQQAVDEALAPVSPPPPAASEAARSPEPHQPPEPRQPVAIPIVSDQSPDGGWLATPWSTARPTGNRYERVR